MNEKPTEEEATFSPPTNEPPAAQSSAFICQRFPLWKKAKIRSGSQRSCYWLLLPLTQRWKMEVKTTDTFNSGGVNLICGERDKMRLGGVTNRHPLLFHFKTTLWPALFATVQSAAQGATANPLQLRQQKPHDGRHSDYCRHVASVVKAVVNWQ